MILPKNCYKLIVFYRKIDLIDLKTKKDQVKKTVCKQKKKHPSYFTQLVV